MSAMRSVENRGPRSRRGGRKLRGWQREAGNVGECRLIGGNRNQRAVADKRVSTRRRLVDIAYPAMESQHQGAQHAVVVQRVDAVAEDAAFALLRDIMLSASNQVDARLWCWGQIALSFRISADQRRGAIPVFTRIVHIEQLRHRTKLAGTIKH